jgi:hypothetical protein
MNKKNFIDIFQNKWEECMKEAKENKTADNDISAVAMDIFNENANAEEVVGYYLTYYGEEAMETWRENVKYVDMNPQDKEVDKLLTILFAVRNDGKDIDISKISSCESMSMNDCEKHCPRYYNCDTIAYANDLLVKYEDKNCERSQKSQSFYFTFGSSLEFPYQHGYVEVKGTTRSEAVAKFRSKYPDRSENTVNCAFIYTEEEWKELLKKYGMGECHDVISI